MHGAPTDVDVKVMDLRIIAADHRARFAQLKKTDKVMSIRVLFVGFIFFNTVQTQILIHVRVLTNINTRTHILSL
jgi:hypothetical protein